MKKIALTLFWSLLFLPMTYAAYFNFVPQTKVQPNGDTLRCFATGDEYFHRLHDANNYTILLDPATGYYVYANKVGDKLVPTSHVAGHVNPAEAGLIPGLSISAEQWRARRQRWEVPTPPHYRSNTRLGNSQENRGHINNIVIFIRFANDAEYSTSFSTVRNMFNDSTAGHSSLYNYFKAVSYNQLFITSIFYPANSGSNIVSYQDSHNRNYFEPYSSSNQQGYADDNERKSREHTLLASAVNAVANQIPSNINIDYNNDGYVDNVVFVVRGNVGDWNDLLWPHRWALYTEHVYINGKRVYDYNFQLADASSYFSTHVLCHEMNHSLGAPDLYHYYEGTNIKPVHTWDLMGQNTNPPQHMGAYMKYKYGYWVDTIPEITECGTYSLHSLGSSATNNCYKIASPNANEFFVLEYRKTSDLFEGTLPSSGLLVYRINTDFNGNSMWDGVDVFDEVYIYRPNGTTTQNGNTNNAAFGSNFGRTKMNASTNPNPFLTDGTVMNENSFTIRNISAAGGDSITFTICLGPIIMTTASVTGITTTHATCGGTVSDDGGNTVTARGVCWSTSQNPTISDSHTTNGSGTGTFYSNINGLSPNTTYHVRAYATNSAGTSYGEEASFTTLCNTTSNTVNASICYGSNYVFYDTNLTEAGTYHHTSIMTNGCDSVTVLNLTVLYGTHNTTTVSECEAYTWTAGTGETYTQSGTYIYQYNPSDGCPSADTLHLTIGESPVVFIQGNTDFCEGDSTTLTASGAEQYSWNTGENTAAININSLGTYTVTGTSSIGCHDTASITVTIWGSESSEFYISDTTCYLWNDIEYCASGDYSQTLQTIHGCDSIVTLHLTIIPVGIKDYTSATNFHISTYPNPTHQSVNVEISDSSIPISKAELYDAMGRKIKVSSWSDKNSTRQIDLKEYAPSLYFIKLYNETNYLGTTKIIKQ